MRAIVFGTAGHIDHGKTSLVKALTGVNCDRLPEEKRRGITLVIGFAPLADPSSEMEISFIDVPGHERLVHTMIAGAGGIDRALLVVAADEGIMPQTREHMDVLALLGVNGGVVALNKIDTVDPELIQLQIQEIRETMVGGPLDGVPVVPCSALTGQGIEELRSSLLSCARDVVRKLEPDRPFRLAIDRVFSRPGAGTVVTGTVRWGSVRVGDQLLALPSQRDFRIRSLQVHGQSRETASVGQRVALALVGASVSDLPRGEQLLGPGAWTPTKRVLVDIKVLASAKPLQEGTQVWLHLLAVRMAGRIERCTPEVLEPGESGRAIVRMARPLFASPGDRVILRSISPAATRAGGVVIDNYPQLLRRREAHRLGQAVNPLTDLTTATQNLVADTGAGGITVDLLAARFGLLSSGIESVLGKLISDRRLLVARNKPTIVVDSKCLLAVRQRAEDIRAGLGAIGIPLAEFLARVLPIDAQHLRSFYLEDLRRAGIVHEVAGRVVPLVQEPVEDALAARIEAIYRETGFLAPAPNDVALKLAAKSKVVDGLIRFLIDRGRLVRVGGKWVLHRSLLDEVVVSLRAWEITTFEVGQFKDRFSLTRKLAIPILEWLDSQRVTRREGERRRVLPNRGDMTPGG